MTGTGGAGNVGSLTLSAERGIMIHDETAAQNSGSAPGFARLARVAYPPLARTCPSPFRP